jgi:hypothetical protein
VFLVLAVVVLQVVSCSIIVSNSIEITMPKTNYKMMVGLKLCYDEKINYIDFLNVILSLWMIIIFLFVNMHAVM